MSFSDILHLQIIFVGRQFEETNLFLNSSSPNPFFIKCCLKPLPFSLVIFFFNSMIEIFRYKFKEFRSCLPLLFLLNTFHPSPKTSPSQSHILEFFKLLTQLGLCAHEYELTHCRVDNPPVDK